MQNKSTANFKKADDLRKELLSRANAAVQEATREWIREDPEARRQYGVKAMNFAYKRSGVPFYKVLMAIVDRMLETDGLKISQKQILAEVQTLFPQGKLNQNIWSRELLPALRSKAQVRIDGNMANPINTKGCKTLSDIRKRLQATAQPKGEAKTFAAKMTFTKERLIVGKKSYAYVLRKSGQKSYFFVHLPSSAKDTKQRSWVKVGALLELVRRM